MKIDREELLEVLKKIISPLSSGGTLNDDVRTFNFSNNYISIYNDCICIAHPFEFKSNIDCSLPAKKLFDIIQRIKGKSINLSIKEGIVKITSKLDTINLKTIEQKKEKYENLFEERSWKRLPSEFLNGLSLCLFSVSREDQEIIYSCINVEENQIMATDRYRITEFTMDKKIKEKFLIEGQAAKELLNFEVKKYFIDKSYLYFKTKDGVIFQCRIIKDSFPDVSKHFKFKGKKIIFPEEIVEAIEISSVLAEGETWLDKKIEIKIKDGQMICKGQGEFGSAERILPIETKSNISFSINPIFFMEILKRCENSLTGLVGEDKILFETKNFKHLISLFLTDEK